MKPFRFVLSAFLLLLLFQGAGAATYGNYTSLNVWGTTSDNIVFSDLTTVSFNSLTDADSSAISEITLSGIFPGTYDLTLTQSNGVVHTGQIISNWSGLLDTSGTWTLTLDGNTITWSDFNVNQLGGSAYIATYAEDTTTKEKGLILTDAWIGNTLTGYGHTVFSPSDYIEQFPITNFEMSGTHTFTATIGYGDYSDVTKEISDEDFSFWTWLGYLEDFVVNAWNAVYSIAYVFKLLLIDHFFEIVVLYEVVISAYAASHSRDLITFLKKFVRYQRKLIEVIIGFIEKVVHIIYMIINSIISI
jgi:hypothetical protein